MESTDLTKVRLMLTGLVKQAEAELANEVAALEARMDDSEELNQMLVDDLRRLVVELAERVKELNAMVARLSEKVTRLRSYGGGGSAAPFDLSSLPTANPAVTPAEVVVKQRGVWVRMQWSDFLVLVKVDGSDLLTYADDYADNYTLSLDGDPLSLS